MRRARALGALFGLALAATSAYPAGEGYISGTVRDEASGLPLADVFVYVYNSNGVQIAEGMTNGAGVYTTDELAAGSYYARTSTWLSRDAYFDELYHEVACPFGQCTVTSGTPIHVTAGATTTGIDFSLTPGGRISGTVTDAATGLPLANVYVAVHTSTGSAVTSGRTDSSGVYTSYAQLPSGSFYARTSNNLGYSDEVYADISCPSGACSVTSGTPISVTAGTTTAGIDFALSPGGRVGGSVTDAVTGLPLADVQVGISDWSGRGVTTVHTGASGTFVTGEGLRSGVYYAQASSAPGGYVAELYDDIPCTGGWCTATSGAPILVTAGATTTGIAFALQPGGRISGTVTLGSTSPPYEDPMRVRIYDSRGRQVASAMTFDSSGSYTTDGELASGNYYAVALAWGHVAELYGDIPCPDGECAVTSGTPITVTAGTTTAGVDFELTPGGRISGTVTDAGTGLPLADVRVDIYDPEGRLALYAYTDTSGVYATSNGLASGSYYARTGFKPGYLGELYDDIPCPREACTVTSGTAIEVTARATTNGVDFALVRGGGISGTVTEAPGLPLEGLWVSIWDSSGRAVTYAETDRSGTYTTSEPLPSGTYYAVASGPYYTSYYLSELYDGIPCSPACSVTDGTPIAVTAGTTTGGVDFALGIGGRISGAVRDATTGFPLAEVLVWIYGSSGSLMTSGYTDSSGVYASQKGLASGTYFARTENQLGYLDEVYDDVPWPGGTVTNGTPISVTAGTTTNGINFGLTPRGRISGTVRDAGTGLPLAGVRVFINRPTGGSVTSATTDGSGEWLTGVSLPPGAYYARTSNSAGYLDEVFDDIACPILTCPVTSGTPISVVAGATTAGIDFGLVRGGRIGGAVRDVATGLPLAYVDVRIYGADGRQIATTLTNALGAYTTHSGPGLTSGTYYARTSNSLGYADEVYGDIPCPGGACTVTAGTPIRVTAGATTGGIDFGLARGGRIGATVADAANGGPLEGVEVSIHDGSGGRVTGGSTDSSGMFTSYDALAPRAYYARTSNKLGYTDELFDDRPCPGGACSVTSGSPIAVTAGAPAATIAFSLSAGGRIGGAVTAAGTGLPLAGARVLIHGSDGRLVTSGSTDASGSYIIGAALPSGTYYGRTESAPGHVDELFDDIPCPLGVCAVTSGTPIGVTAGTTTHGIDFGLEPNPGLGFHTLVPCRVIDTRNAEGPLAGPVLVAGTERTFTLAGACGIPATARAVSVSVTVTQPTGTGNLRLYPAGAPTPPTSTVNYAPGQTRAGNGIVSVNASGAVAVLASPGGTVHVVVDVNGYYE